MGLSASFELARRCHNRSFHPVHWKQSGPRLSGTITGIKGAVNGTAISFGTVGSAAITYSGSVSGKSMSGSYQTSGGGGSWSAHKTS